MRNQWQAWELGRPPGTGKRAGDASDETEQGEVHPDTRVAQHSSERGMCKERRNGDRSADDAGGRSQQTAEPLDTRRHVRRHGMRHDRGHQRVAKPMPVGRGDPVGPAETRLMHEVERGLASGEPVGVEIGHEERADAYAGSDNADPPRPGSYVVFEQRNQSLRTLIDGSRVRRSRILSLATHRRDQA